MKKPIVVVTLVVTLIIAILAVIKALQIASLIKHGKEFVPPPTTVTAAVVKSDSWTEDLTAVGTLTAVQGVTVSAELAGKVVKIAFEPGTTVRQGDLLIRLDTSTEEAQLPGALAAVELARLNRERADKMATEMIISQVDHDTTTANYAQVLAQANSIRTAIAKKTVRAPFSGRLGVRQVNLGQILREGDPIVTLQTLDPIFVDFNLPQQELSQVKIGQPVRVKCDALPGQTVEGKVTAVSPLVDSETRNIRVQATLGNRAESLRPGMFVTVSVGLPVRQQVQTIPATAVLYAPYSDSVFVIEESKDGKGTALRQQFVRVGEKRGDLVAIASGLKPGDRIASTGVFKLRNGQPVVIDNSLTPAFQQSPKPENN